MRSLVLAFVASTAVGFQVPLAGREASTALHAFGGAKKSASFDPSVQLGAQA